MNPIAGLVKNLYVQQEESVLGERSLLYTTFKNDALAYLSITPKWKGEFSNVGAQRARSYKNNLYPYYELKLKFELRATNTISEILWTFMSDYSFANQDYEQEDSKEVKVFKPDVASPVKTFKMWVEMDGLDDMFKIEGIAVADCEMSVSSRTLGTITFGMYALKITQLDPAFLPEFLVEDGWPRIRTKGEFSDCFFTEEDFEDEDMSNYSLPIVKTMTVSLTKKIEPAQFNSSGQPTRYKRTSGIGCTVKLTSVLVEFYNDWLTSFTKQGAMICRFGESDEYYFDVLIPSVYLTLEETPLQNGTGEILFNMQANAIQNMQENAGIVIRLIRKSEAYDGGLVGVTDEYYSAGLDGGNAEDNPLVHPDEKFDFGEIGDE